MPIPVATDQYTWRTPVATLALITLNALAYAALLLIERKYGVEPMRDFVSTMGLSSRNFHLWQPLTYQFVHDPNSMWHVAGNMLFLWIFGTSVEGRLRWWGFLPLYLCGGIVAGLVQLWFSPVLVIGASGAVTAVTGAFIVFFPRAKVSVWLLLSVMPIPAMVLVGIYFALDLLGALGARGGGVAYFAHLSGFVFGFGVAMLLLGTGLVRRTDLDLLYRIKQARRRAEMRSLMKTGNAPGLLPGAAVPASIASPMVEPSPRGERQPNTRLADKCVNDATAAYSRGDFAGAAIAYQRALEAAPDTRDADQTRLMLAVIFGRKLNEPTKAREFLRAIGSHLPEGLRELESTLRVEVKA